MGMIRMSSHQSFLGRRTQASANASTSATGSDSSTLISPISHHTNATGTRLRHRGTVPCVNSRKVSRCNVTNSSANNSAPSHST